MNRLIIPDFINKQYPGFSQSYKTYGDIDIDREVISYMKKFGLEQISNIVQANNQNTKNEFSRRILRAISWYSKATSAHSIADSYLMYAIAIEALLSEE